jgi:hypothetical protein
MPYKLNFKNNFLLLMPKSFWDLPERIKVALIARAAEIEYPIAATIEMAIASFLDTESLAFVDCKPGRGQ